MRKLTLTLSAAALALGAAGTVAYAQSGDRPMRGAEMNRAQVETAATRAFERMDANDDGVLNEADRDARQDAMFARLDTNNDGSLSKEEFFAGRDRMMGGKRGKMAHSGKGMGDMTVGRGGQRMGSMGMGGMARMADTNNDGTITQAEFTAAALAHFDQADTNNDGKVTREERNEARKAMREQHRQSRQAG